MIPLFPFCFSFFTLLFYLIDREQILNDFGVFVFLIESITREREQVLSVEIEQNNSQSYFICFFFLFFIRSLVFSSFSL